MQRLGTAMSAASLAIRHVAMRHALQGIEDGGVLELRGSRRGDRGGESNGRHLRRDRYGWRCIDGDGRSCDESVRWRRLRV